MDQREPKEPHRDAYRGVVIVLLAASVLGVVGSAAGGVQLSDPGLLAVALTLAISAGALAGVATAQAARLRPAQRAEISMSLALADPSPSEVEEREESQDAAPELRVAERLRSRLTTVSQRMALWYRGGETLVRIRRGMAIAGAIVIWLLLGTDTSGFPPRPLTAAIAAALCLIAAGVAATAVRYLGDIGAAQLPESPALCRGARAVAWILALAALSMGLAWADWRTALRLLFYGVMGVNAVICYGLFTAKSPKDSVVFPLDLSVLSVLGNRANIIGSILDSAERQLGIDLRSTWALAVVRRSLEPLLLGLCLIGWLSTAMTVVGIEEQGLIERLGVPVGGEPLLAGLHVHWPWPVDKVFRIPVRRVQLLEVGHEGEEKPGPEDVLWAVEHAPNEFTLLLGNGRDLITVDAGVQFRIVNVRAFRYHCQNPAQALSAIAYRAVMRNTVNLTLSDALSQNVAVLTGRMREMIQREADALGLGVEVLGVHGGRHASTGGGGQGLSGRGLGRASKGHGGGEGASLSRARDSRSRGFGGGEWEHGAVGRRRSPGQGGGRGMELSRAGGAVSRRARPVFFPPPSRDDREGIEGPRLYVGGCPL
jgi:hypothetical protein